MISDGDFGLGRLEIERGSVDFGERCGVGEVSGGEGLGGGDWELLIGGAADLEV